MATLPLKDFAECKMKLGKAKNYMPSFATPAVERLWSTLTLQGDSVNNIVFIYKFPFQPFLGTH